MFVVVIFIIFFEIIIRFTWESFEDAGAGYPDMYKFDPLIGYRPISDYSGNFLGKYYNNISIKINSKGLRDREYSYDRSSITRAVLIGDSVSFGPGLKNDEIYHILLEEKLKKKYPIEIINLGVPGFQFLQEKNYFEIEGKKYSPDILIIQMMPNDLSYVNISDIESDFNILNSSFKKDSFSEGIIKKYCKSCVFIYGIIKNFNTVYFETVYNQWTSNEFNEFEDQFEELKYNLNNDNISLVIIYFPYSQQFTNSYNKGNKPQEKLKELSYKYNFTFIDLTPALDRKNFLSFYLKYDNAHLNSKGNEIVAEYLYDKFINLTIA